jgi:DNA-binding beta-propeller fold protein YncE
MLCAAPRGVEAMSEPNLAFVHAYFDGVGAFQALDSVNDMTLSPDGAHAYAIGHEGITVMARDAVSGRLRVLAIVANPSPSLSEPTAIVLSGDGKHAYVTYGHEDAVAVWARDSGSGLLSFVESQVDGVSGVDGLDGALRAAVSEDGAHVYVTGVFDNTVAAFARNGTTGALSFVEVERDGIGGVDGLAGAYGVAVSGDGGHVYVAGFSDDALAVFDRDAMTGELSFLEVHGDGVSGVDGLDGAAGVVVSEDGLDVYVAGAGDGRVAGFRRDTMSGLLTFNAAAPSTQGVSTLRMFGNELLYAGSTGIAVMSRDPATGSLVLVEIQSNGRRGVQGGGGPSSPSGDGRHLYTANASADAIALFQTTTITCAPTPEVGCRVPVASGKARLLIRDEEIPLGDDFDLPSIDRRDLVKWSWLVGAATTFADFGTPETTTEYALCLYDASAAPQPLLRSVIPPGNLCPRSPCWRAEGAAAGYRYRDRERTPDGVSALTLQAGPAGKAQITAKVKGSNIEGVFDEPLGAPLVPPVRMQLVNSAGECWEAVYSTPAVNDGAFFKATAD